MPPQPRSWADRAVDLAGCVLAVALGALSLGRTLLTPSPVGPGTLAAAQLVDIVCGLLACASLWWRRRWPVGVAVCCLVLGTVSVSATAAGLLALFSLAVHRPPRPVLVVAALWVPSVVLYALYSPTAQPVTSLLAVTPLVLAVTAAGMALRARRQLVQSRIERARMAERTRIAREMHDVLAHRISLLALHAGGLEVRPDLSSAQVRETAALMRTTAREALVELRAVIGVLREPSGEGASPLAPQPTLADLGRLVEQTRQAGAEVDLQLQVDQVDGVPGPLGRDAYRIVQEALTNVSKHASGATARVRVTGAPDRGLRVSIRSTRPVQAQPAPTLPGSGAGLLGLRERVTLAGGSLVHGPDGSGGFVVEADLPWRA